MVSFEKEGKKWGGKKNREEKEKEEIKGRRTKGGGSCAAIQQIFTLRQRLPVEELSRDFTR